MGAHALLLKNDLITSLRLPVSQSSDKTVMHLLGFFQSLSTLTLCPNVVNIPTDMLSRNNLTQFFISQLQVNCLSTM